MNIFQHAMLFFLIIFLLSSLSQIFNDFFASSFYLISQEFSLPIKSAKWFISIYMCGFFISQLIYPLASDSFGRKKPLLIGLIFCIGGCIICYFTPNIHLFFLGRFFQGFGAGAGITMIRPILCDISSRKEFSNYNSYIEVFTGFMIILAANLGSWISIYTMDWRLNFLVMSMYCTLLMYLVIHHIPETITLSSRLSFRYLIFLNHIKSVCQNKHFMKYTGIASITYSGIYMWVTILPVLLEQILKVSRLKYSLLYMIPTLGFILGAALNTLLIKRFSPKKLLFSGILLECLTSILLFFSYNHISVVLDISFFMIGAGLIFPNTTSLALKLFPNCYGIASSIYSTSFILGGFISSTILASFKNTNQNILNLGLCICGAICFMLKHSLQKSSPDFH